MTLNEYQDKAMTTCLPTCDNFAYMMLNLVGEVGEFAGKVAKAIRKNQVSIGSSEDIPFAMPNQLLTDAAIKEYLPVDAELQSEAGDILWQLAGLCKVMGWDLESIAQGNLDKLASRKKEGTLITHKDH